jgi:hypothetical protein
MEEASISMEMEEHGKENGEKIDKMVAVDIRMKEET